MLKNGRWMMVAVAAFTLLLGACAGALPEDFEGVSFEIDGEPSTKLAAEVEFTGLLIPGDDDSWSVAENSFLITNQTEIKGDLAPGQIVKVHAYLNEEGQLVAREIELAEDYEDDDSISFSSDDSSDDDREEEFFGVLESIEGDVWTINGLPVVITNFTEIKGAPGVGEMVKVHALFSEESNQWVAREIEIAGVDETYEDQDKGSDDDEFYGTVESMEGDVWTIGGKTVIVPGSSQMDDDISVGDFVEVHFVVDEDGNRVAVEVELESHEDDVSSSSDLDPEDEDDDDHHYDDHSNDDEEDDDDHEESDHNDDKRDDD